MKTMFKCENCLKETLIHGEGNISVVCQSCGCGDVKFSLDVLLAPVSVSDPGKVFDPVLVKKEESFLGNHSGGLIWRLSFPVQKKQSASAGSTLKSRVK